MNELALYCMAESDEERLNYVMNPAAVAPKMASWASYGQYKDYLPQEAGRSSKTGTCSNHRADGRQHYPPGGFPV